MSSRDDSRPLLADLHGDVASTFLPAASVGCAIGVAEVQIERFEGPHGLVELATEGLECLVMLGFSSAYARQQFGFGLLEIFGQGSELSEGACV
ncbi:hypothetical protein HYQ46_004985 [Verticillium longisporum]|nr:hypothetical protein HYQ46_004985 [Verticillium longisporum]